MPGERFTNREVYDEQEPETDNKHEPRSCVICGATKTPQWREGPEGPKTLCNACGVKRARKRKRLEIEETKKLSEAVEDQPQNLHTVKEFRESRRQPHAAVEPERLLLQPHTLPSNLEASHHPYDAEDLRKVPNRRARLRERSAVPEMQGTEIAAAVDLLSMSQGRRSGTQHVAQQLQPQGLGETAAAMIASNCLRTVLGNYTEFAQTSDSITQALPQLATEQQEEWWALKCQMEALFQESAAANASADAVEKMLELKRAYAADARTRLQMKAASLYPFVKHLEETCVRINAAIRQGRGPL